MSAGSASPFFFLDDLLNILIIDAGTEDRTRLANLLAPARCFCIEQAVSTSEAREKIRSGKRFHCIITELGMDDVDDDEFYIPRNYAHHCSVMILTASTSPVKGATCAWLGARAVFEKGDRFDERKFFLALTDMLTINIVNLRYSQNTNDTLNMATRTLLETAPQTVTEWADKMRITDRQLRNLWHTESGFGAKHILFLFHCFKRAFAYYETILFTPSHNKKEAERHFSQRHYSYFTTHRELLTFILS